jgi:metal-sulfur cluster biosynthetic enzyme
VGATPGLVDAVWAALATVLDPELDQPITELGFVASCDVDAAGRVVVRLRLPTYFCAANFVFLMVADARAALGGVPGVVHADVAVTDHFAAEAINAGVADGRGFVGTFGELAEGELHQLRADFQRKALLAATERVCSALSAGGWSEGRLASVTLGQASAVAPTGRVRELRAHLGLPAGDDDPLVVDPVSGHGVDAAALPPYLRRARLHRVGIEANAELCQGLLRDRYREESLMIRRPHRLAPGPARGGGFSAPRRGAVPAGEASCTSGRRAPD